jgi:hypothetical protein
MVSTAVPAPKKIRCIPPLPPQKEIILKPKSTYRYYIVKLNFCHCTVIRFVSTRENLAFAPSRV